MKKYQWLWLIALAGLMNSCYQAKSAEKLTLAEQAIQHCQASKQDSVKLHWINKVCSQIQKNEEAQPNPDYWAGILYHMPYFVEVVQRLKQPHHQVFMDVGSGNAEKLFVALGLGFQQAMGIEYNPDLVQMSKANFLQLHQQQTMQTFAGDALKINANLYQKADFIYLYSPIKNDRLMAKLFERILLHMKDGATLIEVNMKYIESVRDLSHLKFPSLNSGWLAIKKEKGKYYFAQSFYTKGADWIRLTVK